MSDYKFVLTNLPLDFIKKETLARDDAEGGDVNS